MGDFGAQTQHERGDGMNFDHMVINAMNAAKLYAEKTEKQVPVQKTAQNNTHQNQSPRRCKAVA